ncbi:MAG: hypothetical protein ACP5LA_02810 [Thermoplasmata archaeon]
MIIIKPENLLYYLPQMIFGIIVAYVLYRIFSKYKLRIEQNTQALSKYLEFVNEQNEKYEDLKAVSIKLPKAKISAMGIDADKFSSIIVSKQSEIVKPNKLNDGIKNYEERNYIFSHLLIYMVISIWIGLMILLSPYKLARIFTPEFSNDVNIIILVILASLIYVSLLSLTYYIYGRRKDMIWTFQAAMTGMLLAAMFFPSMMPIWSGNIRTFALMYISLLFIFTVLHLLVIYSKKRVNFLITSYFTIFIANAIFDIILVMNLVAFIILHS